MNKKTATTSSGKKVEQGDDLSPEDEALVDAAWLKEVSKGKAKSATSSKTVIKKK